MPILPKEYDPHEVEIKWQKFWEEKGLYKFDEKNLEKAYVIDTPPPYPTGELHMGHVLNWVYMDIVARYLRMKGYNVMFPQGWDCHGLPTEVKVEEIHGIKKNDVPKEEFRKLCIELTTKNIERMKKQMKRLGFSIDWSREYVTMTKDYIRKSQLAFVRMYKDNLIYQGRHAVNYCPRCETVIAFAEVEYDTRESYLNYIKFYYDNGYVVIATTRPELLGACVAVAVNPRDKRYKHLVGKTLRTPIYNREVKVIEDEAVDMDFGTGIVMICTFGDKQDVEWVKKHKLKVIRLIDKNGKLSKEAGRYAGLSVEEARKRIIEDLEKEGHLIKREKITQNVGRCWRCKTPIEILEEKQWFVRVRALREKILEAAEKIEWIPDYMKHRLINWVNSMTWDWVISRQRIFATPIPVWYCKKCGYVIVAKEEWLPVFPENESPREPCPRCGSTDFDPERDVLDTWMDSSITPLVIAGWPDNKELFEKLYPTHLRPQGHDIIRTWAFYTIVKSLALTNDIPWFKILINGMVLGEDGRKMSKSLGNVVEPDEMIKKYGADALRQWAAMGGSVGSDIPFSEKDVKFGNRFLRKFYNAIRFASQFFDDFKEDSEKEFDIADRWILSKLNRLIEKVDSYLADYRFDKAIISIQDFVWHDFCDNYIEEVKHRLYSKKDEKDRQAAIYTLREVVENTIKLLAPFTPHFSEEIYQKFFSKGESIHETEFPKAKKEFISEEYEFKGGVVNKIISALRKYKSEKKLPLSYEIKEVIIYPKDSKEVEEAIKSGIETIKGTARIKNIKIEQAEVEEKVSEIVPNYAKIGPKFKEKAKKIIDFMKNNKDLVAKKINEGIRVKVDGEEILLTKDYVKEIKKVAVVKGEKVSVVVPEQLDVKIIIKEQ